VSKQTILCILVKMLYAVALQIINTTYLINGSYKSLTPLTQALIWFMIRVLHVMLHAYSAAAAVMLCPLGKLLAIC